jgi:hypothetical protein
MLRDTTEWQNNKLVLWIGIGFNADPDQLFVSKRIRIRIQGAKRMRIHANPDLDLTHTHKKLNFYIKLVIGL